MKQFKEVNLATFPTVDLPTYDPTKISKGNLLVQSNISGDKFFGPKPIGIARPMEESTTLAAGFPYAISMGNNKQWVFFSHQITASATRVIGLYEFYENSMSYVWKGYITLNFPTTTVHTTRGFRPILEHYNTGTISASGTTVTGSGTTWSTDRMNVGSVIGFGSNNPAQITQWYEISSVDSNTGLTLTQNVGTIAAGTPYVIRELMIAIVTTNATVTNGGLFVIKGISELDFSGMRSIPAATTTDLQKAVYWLADAATQTNTVSCGVSYNDKVSQTEQLVYVPNFVAPNYKIYVYNLRQPLTSITAGKSLEAFRFSTGNQTYTGVASQQNNARIGVINHGVAAGIKSLFVATTTRIYRAPLTAIVDGSTSFFSDVMVEVPPGGTSVSPLSSVMQAVEIASAADMLLITTTNGTAMPSYATKYNTTSQPFDLMFITDDKLYNYNSTPTTVPIYPNSLSLTCQLFAENGYLHVCRSSTTTTCAIYCIPYAADYNWSDTTMQYAITPEISTPNATKYYNLYVNNKHKLGEDPFAVSIEPFKVYYRTTGIADNTGAWNLLTDVGDLSVIAPSNSVQFKFAFRILGPTCIPARLYSIAVAYEDGFTDSHYDASVSKSSTSARMFAWRQSESFTGNIPTLKIKIYNTATNSLILEDSTLSPTQGVWEYSTDGDTWLAWDSTQNVIGNYIRYAATSLPSNIKVRVTLTQ